MNMAFMSLNQIDVSYDKKKQILKGLNLKMCIRDRYYTVCIGLAVDGSRPGVYFNHLNSLEGGSEV